MVICDYVCARPDDDGGDCRCQKADLLSVLSGVRPLLCTGRSAELDGNVLQT